MKIRGGFVSNSSTSSFILTPKREHYAEVVAFIKAHMVKGEDEWMGVWFKEINGRQIAGGESCIFILHDTWLAHPEWFSWGQLETDMLSNCFFLKDGKWKYTVVDWDHAQDIDKDGKVINDADATAKKP